MAAPAWKLALVHTLAMVSRSAATWTASSIGLTGYNATDPRRKILSNSRKPAQATANELANGSLSALRNYSRNIERNNPTARAAVDGLVALVVGSGIDLEPDTGDKATDELIRDEWKEWCNSCGVDGRDIFQLQGQAFRDVVTAGEGLWRFVILPERKADGEIPLAILPLEPEWLNQFTVGTIYNADGSAQVGPIIMDKYGRPVSYNLLNPETSAGQTAEIVPASAIAHMFERRRSMQSRGEPWFAPIIETLQQERDLVDAELQAAVTSSSIGIAVTSAYHDTLDTTEEGDTTDPAQSLRIGSVARLFPGDDVKPFSNTRPSQQIMPFRAGLRGDTAAAMRIPQRYLDRDPSRANYSSMRADMLDTDRLLGPVREWYGHATIGRCYKEVLPFLALRAGIPMPRSHYRLIPDGQPYVDPYKDAQAAALAISSGISTFEAEIGKRGGDYTKVWEQLKKEQDLAASLGIKIDLSGTNAPAPQPSLGTVDGEKPSSPTQPPPPQDTQTADDMQRMQRSIEGLQSRAGVVVHNHIPASNVAVAAPQVTVEAARVDVPATVVNLPETVVNVAAPVVNIAATEVRNEIAAPVIPAPIVNVAAPVVNVAAPIVNVDNKVIVPQRTIHATPDGRGGVIMTPQE